MNAPSHRRPLPVSGHVRRTDVRALNTHGILSKGSSVLCDRSDVVRSDPRAPACRAPSALSALRPASLSLRVVDTENPPLAAKLRRAFCTNNVVLILAPRLPPGKVCSVAQRV